ncbi:hypothetical protein QJQ45_024207, partial [Haematococcus lacustris]
VAELCSFLEQCMGLQPGYWQQEPRTCIAGPATLPVPTQPKHCAPYPAQPTPASNSHQAASGGGSGSSNSQGGRGLPRRHSGGGDGSSGGRARAGATSGSVPTKTFEPAATQPTWQLALLLVSVDQRQVLGLLLAQRCRKAQPGRLLTSQPPPSGHAVGQTSPLGTARLQASPSRHLALEDAADMAGPHAAAAAAAVGALAMPKAGGPSHGGTPPANSATPLSVETSEQPCGSDPCSTLNPCLDPGLRGNGVALASPTPSLACSSQAATAICQDSEAVSQTAPGVPCVKRGSSGDVLPSSSQLPGGDPPSAASPSALNCQQADPVSSSMAESDQGVSHMQAMHPCKRSRSLPAMQAEKQTMFSRVESQPLQQQPGHATSVSQRQGGAKQIEAGQSDAEGHMMPDYSRPAANAQLGIRLLWVVPACRRKGLAACMVDMARCHHLPNYVVPRQQVAFAHTPLLDSAATKFALSYSARSGGCPVLLYDACV